jgi:hypothetical protein
MTNAEAWILIAVILASLGFVVACLAMYRALEASDALAQQLKSIEGAHKTASLAQSHAVAVRNDCATLGKQVARDSADISILRMHVTSIQDDLAQSRVSAPLPRTSAPIAIPPSPWKKAPK